ncbi:MAG: D-alanine--D-alanine ligase, partial [Gemmatimonadetes bacterium]|nr:D-alanine--D-alanine ligase [Gemmatimonadota bacterium]
MKKLRVLALMHDHLVPPEDVSGVDLATAKWKTEFDVTSTLRELGHDVRVLGVKDDLGVIRQAVDEFKPHIAFNLMEAFHDVGVFDMNVVSYLELLRLPYTGCNPRGMVLTRDKALSKKLMAFHRIPVPEFAVIHRERTIKLSRRLHFPVIVKPLTQQSSVGISQASVVEDDASLRERVRFIHESVGTDAILEQFI